MASRETRPIVGFMVAVVVIVVVAFGLLFLALITGVAFLAWASVVVPILGFVGATYWLVRRTRKN